MTALVVNADAWATHGPPHVCQGQTVTQVSLQQTSNGTDQVTGTLGVDVVATGLGDDAGVVGAGDDFFCGNEGNENALYGGSGRDTMNGGAGRDSLLGDDGRDTIWVAGVAANPDSAWVIQQARNLAMDGELGNVRFLIRDRDAKFVAAFDEVFRSEGARVIQRPVRAPKANAYTERFIRTIRSDCSISCSCWAGGICSGSWPTTRRTTTRTGRTAGSTSPRPRRSNSEQSMSRFARS
jgi:hypothetical protein